MRKMQDFIMKNKSIYIGLEDSKKTWKLAVRCDKMLIHQTSMAAEYPSLIGYFRNKFPGCRIQVIYEAGFKGFWLHDFLVRDGISCVVVPPHTVLEEKANRVKTDKIDARRLAENLENGGYKSCYVPDRERREDRQISRTIEDVQSDITRTRNRIWKMFDFHGVTPPIHRDKARKDDIRKLRDFSVAKPLSSALKTYIDLLEHLWRHLQELRSELRTLTKKDKYRKTYDIIRSIPGIGWFTAIRLVLEWGEDMSRFANRRKIASFVGLSMAEHSSGDTVRRGSLTGLGHKRSRSWIVECAWIAIRHDPVLLDKFKRVWRNTGSKKKAIVAVARKLVGRLLHCVKIGQPYVVGLVSEQ
jgi:transposase